MHLFIAYCRLHTRVSSRTEHSSAAPNCLFAFCLTVWMHFMGGILRRQWASFQFACMHSNNCDLFAHAWEFVHCHDGRYDLHLGLPSDTSRRACGLAHWSSRSCAVHHAQLARLCVNVCTSGRTCISCMIDKFGSARDLSSTFTVIFPVPVLFAEPCRSPIVAWLKGSSLTPSQRTNTTRRSRRQTVKWCTFRSQLFRVGDATTLSIANMRSQHLKQRHAQMQHSWMWRRSISNDTQMWWNRCLISTRTSSSAILQDPHPQSLQCTTSSQSTGKKKGRRLRTKTSWGWLIKQRERWMHSCLFHKLKLSGSTMESTSHAMFEGSNMGTVMSYLWTLWMQCCTACSNAAQHAPKSQIG